MEPGVLGRLGEDGGHVTKRAEEEIKSDTVYDSVTIQYRKMAAVIVLDPTRGGKSKLVR